MSARKQYKKDGLIRKPRRFEDFIRKIKPSYRSKRELKESILTLYKRSLEMSSETVHQEYEIKEIYSKVVFTGDFNVLEKCFPNTERSVTESLILKIKDFIQVEHVIDDSANHIVVASIKIAQDKEEKENVK